MSFHLHLRAVAEDEIRDDHASLVEFMGSAWDNHETEYAAGIAESIAKDFGPLNDLYLAGPTLVGGTSSWDLPIYGGRIVPAHMDQQPPFVILDPDQVATVADLLAGASFEALWQVEGAKLTAPYAQWEDPEGAAKENYLAHHTGLRDFYCRAAAAHRAVVKAFWY
ncbi:hypothetical protein SSP24_11110 [Streptomyces spinoverrucosus]|uniref:DUF1877 domain-containing protein n=1 Tax=Streptomyces spinoverrucosus TaxID=284043 RepID=A0A4Y3VEP6_9ACTN|nr:DUF1877 family protein [Streptomyces spinoverrucosus]GEC03456.1 hypothetical protein SSP24_11110 [Streptomyces spinoverrucosus]GHB35511.1 hypothetical protein GCM10010397_01460 [Streptomyces spinoverrucosus]